MTGEPPNPEPAGFTFADALEATWTFDPPDPAPSPAPVSTPSEASATPPPPERILEALLFVGGVPLTLDRALRIVRGLNGDQFRDAIHALNQRYRRQNRPYTILARDHGYILALKPKYLHLQEKLFGGVREARLSTAAIDVLALIAYRQPTTKEEVDSLRGAESGPLLRQLVRRGLAQVVYRGEAEQREVMYGTTPRFLELFGLSSLDDLPKTQDVGP